MTLGHGYHPMPELDTLRMDLNVAYDRIKSLEAERDQARAERDAAREGRDQLLARLEADPERAAIAAVDGITQVLREDDAECHALLDRLGVWRYDGEEQMAISERLGLLVDPPVPPGPPAAPQASHVREMHG